jgi:hypothetical protein
MELAIITIMGRYMGVYSPSGTEEEDITRQEETSANGWQGSEGCYISL